VSKNPNKNAVFILRKWLMREFHAFLREIHANGGVAAVVENAAKSGLETGVCCFAPK